MNAQGLKVEKNPSETIKCLPGITYSIYVNNFRWRVKKSTPFTVVIREPGKPDIMLDHEWPSTQPCGEYMLITTHTFGTNSVESGLPTLSDKSIRRITANEASWNNIIGTPTSVISSVDDFIHYGHTVVEFSEKHQKPQHIQTASAQTVSDNFMSMVRSAQSSSSRSSQPQSRKKLLSENCGPTTTSELFQLGGDQQVQIDFRNYAPGHCNKITTKTNDFISLCHYIKLGEFPCNPGNPENSKLGTARLDDKWVNVSSHYNHLIDVTHMVKIGNQYFFVLKGAKLPEDVLLGGGFYPTDLTPECHIHRLRWLHFHSNLRPVVQKTGIPAIDTFLVGTEIEIVLNGVVMTLKN